MNGATLLVSALAALVPAAAAFLLLWLIYRAARLLAAWVSRAVADRQGAPLDMLIGIGVAAILVPAVPRALVGLFSAFLSGTLAGLRLILDERIRAAFDVCQKSVDGCPVGIHNVGLGFLGAADLIINRLGLGGFPLVSLIIFTLVAALATTAASVIRQGRTLPAPVLASMSRPGVWRGTALTAVALAATYLSLTAVMAIPLFDDANRQTGSLFTAERLAADLGQILPHQTENGKLAPRQYGPLVPAWEAPVAAAVVPEREPAPAPNIQPGSPAPSPQPAPGSPADPNAAASSRQPATEPVDRRLATAAPQPALPEARPPPAVQPPVQPNPGSADDDAYRHLRSTLLSQYGRLTASHRRLEEAAARNAAVYRQAAVEAFIANNEGRLGGRERARHFSDLSGWYRERVDGLREQLDQCAASIASFANFANLIPGIVSSRSGEEGGSGYFVQAVTADATNIGSAAEQRCAPPRLPTSSMPPRKDYGEFLGPAGLMTRWLIGTESREIALIAGLVGFGLLGAFVSWLAERKPKAPIEYADVGSVLLRGFGAAVVVFLGSYGGLAAIGQSGQQPHPNPYVVFFLCLVGAVFSGDVWRWARGRLPGNTDPKDGSNRSGNTDQKGSGGVQNQSA